MNKLNNVIIDKYDFSYKKYYENETIYIYDYFSPVGLTGKIVFIKNRDEEGNEIFPDINDFGVCAWTIVDKEYLLEFLKEKFGKTYIYGEKNELLECEPEEC